MVERDAGALSCTVKYKTEDKCKHDEFLAIYVKCARVTLLLFLYLPTKCCAFSGVRVAHSLVFCAVLCT